MFWDNVAAVLPSLVMAAFFVALLVTAARATDWRDTERETGRETGRDPARSDREESRTVSSDEQPKA